jgi:SOS response regulatory protein OraA/RecX
VKSGDWGKSLDSLLSKGYTQKELSYLLAEILGCAPNTAVFWLNKKAKPRKEAQKAILDLDKKLIPRAGFDWAGDWEEAVNSLLRKGYRKSELSRIIGEHVGCNPSTAITWVMKKSKPPLDVQQAIVSLDETLSSIKWEAAIDSLIEKGYNRSMISDILCQKFKCKFNTALGWVSKKYRPTLGMQKKIVELDRNLPNINWRAAVENLLSKGYSKAELGRMLCERIKCRPVTAARWFGKPRKLPGHVRQAIVRLDQEIGPR